MKPLMIDSNVVFIATGQIGEAWAAVILEEVAKGKISGATDALFIQEILDVYFRENTHRLGRRMARSYAALCECILPVTVEDFDLSAELFAKGEACSPRELLHSAVMRNHGIEKIFSVDGPAAFPGVERVALRTLLQELGLKGNYIHDRSKQPLP